MKLSKASGFLPRSVSIEDRQSHYIESSRDQYTHYCRGIWRFYHSPLADDTQRTSIWRIITDICTRMEELVIAENNYSLCREDEKPRAGHEWARLPMIYLIGWDLTGEEHRRQLFKFGFQKL